MVAMLKELRNEIAVSQVLSVVAVAVVLRRDCRRAGAAGRARRPTIRASA